MSRDRTVIYSLRPVEPLDVEPLYRWRNNPAVRAISRNPDEIPWERHVKFWAGKILSGDSLQMIAMCGLEAIGSVSLAHDETNATAEFSIYLAPDKIGLGHGAPVMRLLRDYAFQTLGVETLTAETLGVNVRAHKCFTAIGMRVDGFRRSVFIRDGKRVGAWILSMTRDEWKALQS